jgi:hypothetical protein
VGLHVGLLVHQLGHRAERLPDVVDLRFRHRFEQRRARSHVERRVGQVVEGAVRHGEVVVRLDERFGEPGDAPRRRADGVAWRQVGVRRLVGHLRTLRPLSTRLAEPTYRPAAVVGLPAHPLDAPRCAHSVRRTTSTATSSSRHGSSS